MAQLDVLDVIGDEKYEEILADEESEDYAKLQTAENYLVLKYLLPALNIESTGSGVTKATGFGDSRKENISEFDLDKIINRYESNAMRILKNYAKEVDQDEDGNPDVVSVPGLRMACITEEVEDE